MARTGLAILGGVVGAIIGLPFGQPVLGAQIGFLVGGGVGAAAFPEKGPVVEGPRLRDLDVQASSYGLPIPIVFGTTRLAGNVIWAPQIKETRREATVGGKGGGGGQTTVTFTYSIDCAIGICEGPITGIRKVWADTKLIYDIADDATADEQLASSIQLAVELDDETKVKVIFGLHPGTLGAMKIYPGTQTAKPEPLIEADKGTGDVPAFRGLAYVVFDDFQLANFGNRIPNFSFEVVFAGTETSSEIAHVPSVDSDGFVYETNQATFVDGNGEMIVLYSIDSGHTSPGHYDSIKFKAARTVGTTLIDMPKVPPIVGTKLASTERFEMIAKAHMDHPGYVIEDQDNSPVGSVWMAHYDTQTWTEFSQGFGLNPSGGSFSFAQRGGDAVLQYSGSVKHYTSEGAFIQEIAVATNDQIDIGISDNFFWQLRDVSGAELRRLKKK